MLHDGQPIDETDPVYIAEVALWHARLEAMDRDNGRTAAQSARIVLAAARNLRAVQAAAPEQPSEAGDCDDWCPCACSEPEAV
jgi:hypothetical protein